MASTTKRGLPPTRDDYAKRLGEDELAELLTAKAGRIILRIYDLTEDAVEQMHKELYATSRSSRGTHINSHVARSLLSLQKTAVGLMDMHEELLQLMVQGDLDEGEDMADKAERLREAFRVLSGESKTKK